MARPTVSDVKRKVREAFGNLPGLEEIISECATAHPKSPRNFLICVINKVKELLRKLSKDDEGRIDKLMEWLEKESNRPSVDTPNMEM